MTILLVEVTQDDIDEGCRGRTFNCPVSRAVQRAYGDKMVVGVQASMVEFGNFIDGNIENWKAVFLVTPPPVRSEERRGG